MNVYEARLLDLALREIVGGETAPDVLSQLRRTRRVRRLRLRGLALAATVLLAVGAWWLWPVVPTIELDEGVHTIEGPARVFTPLATIELPDGATARITRQPTDGDVIVEVLTGSVSVNGVSVAVGEVRVVLGPKEKSMLDDLVERALVEPGDLSTPQAQDRFKSAEATRGQLAAILEAKPARYTHLRTRLQELSDDAELRKWQLETLLGDPDPKSVALARRALHAKPVDASVELALRLAEAGDKVFAQELLRRATSTPEHAATLPAVFHGLRGDRSAVPTLLWFRGSGFVRSQHDLYIAVAAALRATGQPQHWDGARSFTRREVERALRAGNLEVARRALLRLEYFASQKPVPVHQLSRRLFDHARANESRFKTRAEIQARVEQLR